MIDEALDGLPHAETVPDSPEPDVRTRLMEGLVEAVLLALIVALALLLRFTGIRWGTGYYLHPDELFMTNVLSKISMPSSIGEYFDSQTSPLNPFNHDTGFVYGTFPLFAAEWIGSFTKYTAIQNMQIPGRWLSALADTGTVVLVWWIGRMLFGRFTGLLAALLLACTMLNVQAAHYFTTDSWSAFFATATYAFVLSAWQKRRWSLYALAGLALGLAVASKPNLLAAIGFIALPALETVRLYGWGALLPRVSKLPDDDETPRTFPVLFASALSVFVAIWTFRLLQPYAFQGPSIFSFRFDSRWLADIDYWRLVQSGELDYYPGIQWVERAPVFFMLDNMVRWGMGPGLGIAALGGTLLLAGKIVWRCAWPSWMILGMVGWVAFHIVYFGIGMVKTQRYLLPAYPLLVVMAAMALVLLVRWAQGRGVLRIPRFDWTIRFPQWIHPGYVLPLLVVISTALYGIAFISIYRTEQTRAAASVWITENVPDGSVIGNEYWDLGLPVNVPELAGHSYETINLHLYADENAEKVQEIVAQLEQVDYIVLSSNRLIDSITRMPERYPMATRYYEALYSGELGFEQVAHFTSFPEVFGISIDDRSAEETLTVYDHPEVTVFRKTEDFDAQNAFFILSGALGQGGLNIRPIQTQPHRMMLTDDQQVEVAGHGSWLDIFDPGSLANRYPLAAWYLALQVLSVPAVLFLWRFAPWLPDRGYALAKTTGLFAVTWVVWWLCSWDWLTFGRPIVVAAWLVLSAVSAALLWRQRGGLRASVADRFGWIVATETILLAGLVAASLVRRQNPDLWIPDRNGTQLQNMGTFNALIRTPHFPAYDSGFAGGTIHDAVFGLLPWAMVARLTGIAPETAYSLALVTMAALVLLNAWAAASVLIKRLRPAWRTGGAIACGLFAPLLMLAIGSWTMAQRIGANDWTANFDGSPLDALAGLWDTITGNPHVPAQAWYSISTYIGPGTLEFPLMSYLSGELAVQQAAMPVFIAGLIVVLGFLTQPVTASVAQRAGARAEQAPQPYLEGDWPVPHLLPLYHSELARNLSAEPVHPEKRADTHSLTLAGRPLQTTERAPDPKLSGREGVGMGAPSASPQDDGPHGAADGAGTVLALLGPWRISLGFLVGLGIVVAWVLAANILAGGVLAGVAGVMILLSMLARPDTDGSWPVVRDGVVALAVLGGAVLVAAWPFLLHYGYIPTARLPLDQSLDVSEFVAFGGAALAVLAAYLVWRLVRCGWSLALEGVVGPVELVIVPVLLAVAFTLAWLLGILLVFLMLLFVVTGIVLWERHRERAELAIPALMLVAVGLAVVGNRMKLDGWASQQNIPLQFAVLTWVVLGVAAAPAIAIALGAVRSAATPLATVGRWIAGAGVTVLLVGAIGMGAVYPVVALPSRADARLVQTEDTFNAWAFMAQGQLSNDANGMPVQPYPLAGDLAAVDWMREHIVGLPVILEAPGNPGTWGGRVSALTGFPAVLGSPDVQRQQRPGMERMVDWRVADINTIYGAAGSYQDVVGLVLLYGVQYIYVGQLEQVTYGAGPLTKFDQAVQVGMLEVAWRGDGVTIYRVVDSVG